jgi:outer membrane immunogenic protein
MATTANGNAATLRSSAPEIAAPGYDWTGAYFGINAGYAQRANSAATTFNPNDPGAYDATCGSFWGASCPEPVSYGTRGGALGGVQAGYNWQMNPTWVIGVEADFNASGMKEHGTSRIFGLDGFASRFRGERTLDWFGTVRARLGCLPTSRLLIYGTGGVAYGRSSETISLDAPAGLGAGTPPYSYDCVTQTGCFIGASSRLATGWTAGAGFEYSFWKNVSIKGEYLYVGLGGGSTNVVAQNTLGPTDTPSSFTASHTSNDFHVFRVGLNVKLGGL